MSGRHVYIDANIWPRLTCSSVNSPLCLPHGCRERHFGRAQDTFAKSECFRKSYSVGKQALEIRVQESLDVNDEQKGPEDKMGDDSSTVPRVACRD